MPTTCPSDRRAEGQIGDVIRPIEERRDCSGVITQLAAFPSTRPRPIHDHRERVATVHQRRRHGDTESGATGDAVPLIGLQHVLVDRDKVRGLARAAETSSGHSRPPSLRTRAVDDASGSVAGTFGDSLTAALSQWAAAGLREALR